MQLLLFWLCINHYWTNHVWTQISPSIAILPCSALVLQPQTQSACNRHWLCENPLDCVGLRNPSQSWLWWIAPQFGGLPRDFTGLDAHNRLSNPKNCIAIHSIRSQSKSWDYVKAGGLRGFWGQNLTNFLKFFSTFWAIMGTFDIWDTDYNTDNWEPGFMTIFVILQLIVTLDSILNSCDVWTDIT